MEKAKDSTMEDDSVLDISEQLNRPLDIDVQQQRIPSWHPILDPEWMIYTYLILSVILIPLGEFIFYVTLQVNCRKQNCGLLKLIYFRLAFFFTTRILH